ncbi:hypothetical protein Z042_23085 [Chania multitudinisentens RB-25]|uniref:Uncharacterized protein n=1 Tax=Chania multitudinisentens RB-25 TaxID=1441930 RepID=W0LE88_9GAMM|nr:hypothetical protein [Chania multitudinisentens]AHG22173.1 hypothetical protein Z042_23085 [Chania multitudinisentens RB-25]
MIQKHPVTEQERQCINDGIHKLRQVGKFDGANTQAAISARLREVSAVRHGVLKQVCTVHHEETGKTTWFYRLVPSQAEVRA